MKQRPALAVILATSVAASLSACGGDADATEDSGGDSGPAKVSFAAISVAQVAPIVLAQEQGIFTDNNIDLEINFIEPAAVVPSLVSGDADFGWLNAPAVLAARSNNVPVKSVTTGSTAGEDPEAFPIQLLVPADSDIKTPADLEGKTVAVDTLFQLPDLGLRAALSDAGVDPQSIEAVEIPFPDMGTALEGGRVDAILSTEPFVSINEQMSGAVPLLSAVSGQAAETPQGVVLSSEQFIDGNAEVVENFRTAMDEATEYANANEDEMRATIPTFTQLEPELADSIDIAPVDTTDDPAGWDAWADLLVEVGALDERPDATEAFLAD